MSFIFYSRKNNSGIYSGFYSEHLLMSNPDTYFVFGDNLVRRGNGGQAIIRDQPNAVGIATKRFPTHNYSGYMLGSKEDFEAVEKDFDKVYKLIEEGKTIVFPSGGLGTGLAALNVHAPKLLTYIDHLVSKLIEADYTTIHKYPR
jgi:hypothetical protein